MIICTLREVRERLGLSQAQLSRRTARIGHKIHQQSISEYEAQQHLPNCKSLGTLCAALGCSASDLLRVID